MRWWAQQDEDMRAVVSQLVRNGQASGVGLQLVVMFC